MRGLTSKPKQKKQPASKSSGKGLAMVIDSEVNERDEGIFYLLPSEMSKSGLLNPEKFDSCDIRNVEVDDQTFSFIRNTFIS